MNFPKGISFLAGNCRPATEEEINNPRAHTFATFWPDGGLKKVQYYDEHGESDPYHVLALEYNKEEGKYWDTLRSYTEYSDGCATTNVDCGDETCSNTENISFEKFVKEGLTMFEMPVILVLPPGRQIKL
ncbi:MAG: hypothetical protein ABRQ38_16510 [Candidatus Eremiobacterota bacterium]